MNLPLIFKSKQLRCLLIGGGEVAERKLRILVKAECATTILSPAITSEITTEVDNGNVNWLKRDYEAGDCQGYGLVIAATNNRSINTKISQEAKAVGIPINVVDDPSLCTVYFPAVSVDKDLMLAVSTGGVAPFMAAEIRDRLAEHSKDWGTWVETAEALRRVVRNSIDDPSARTSIFNRYAALDPASMSDRPPEQAPLSVWLDWLDKAAG